MFVATFDVAADNKVAQRFGQVECFSTNYFVK